MCGCDDYYFTVLFGHEGQKPLELRCEEEQAGKEWMEAIHQASYADILIEREVLMQKYIHLVQIVETEKIAANQLRHQLEDQDTEIERLKSEIVALNKTKERMRPYHSHPEDEDPDIKKIKKASEYKGQCVTDLFDILLPMLNIYQEFVRNHQYSLQVLANCKQNRDFDKLLKQYEANPACEGRMLETFLTYPMFQ
ncbi:hypothetical protein A6R68_12998, partial [Neotoma lepida]